MINKNSVAIPLFIMVFVGLTSGCAIRSVYIPLSQDSPLFDTNKQIKASGYLGTNHVELQVAHNPFNKFAFATNVYFGAGVADYDAAIGTYGCSKNEKWKYELFGGYGYNTNTDYNGGNLLSATQKVSYNVNSVYNRFYIQPSVGYFGNIDMYRIKYSFSLSAKISYLFFNDYLYQEKNDALSTPIMPFYIINREYQNKGVYTFEPCLTNKVGIRNVSAILQVQSTSPYSQEINVASTKFSPAIFFSLGIQYTFTFKVKPW